MKPLSALSSVRAWADEAHKRVIAHYHQLHRFPELSWREERTASYVEQALRDLGLEPLRRSGTGIIADLDGKLDLPRRALRADLDAVAIHEATGLPHASENPGVMHACGHDAHTAILLGAAQVLVERAPVRRRPLRLIFQPAEEVIPSGAVRLIEEGVLEGVADIITLHVWPALESGRVGLKDGLVTAAADAFECTLMGPGGHGARPHEAVDIISLAARIIPMLVDLPRTLFNPLRQPAVISVGTIHGGESFNVIPDSVRFGGTARTVEARAREALPEKMDAVICNLARAAGADYKLTYHEGPPAMQNHPELVRLAGTVLDDVLGPGAAVRLEHSSMGGEDFAHFAARVPGLLLRLGCAPRGGVGAPLHSSLFRIDEESLAVGVAALAGMALGGP
jgi:amidohydrolase